MEGRIGKFEWLKILILWFTCFFTSALYYGWQHMSRMLAKSGAYIWQCDSPTTDLSRSFSHEWTGFVGAIPMSEFREPSEYVSRSGPLGLSQDLLSDLPILEEYVGNADVRYRDPPSEYYQPFLNGTRILMTEQDPIVCTNQDKSIGRLFTLAAGFDYLSAALAGVLLDHVGIKYSALTGELIWLLGILLMMLSSKRFQGYIPGFIFLGSAVNTICFPSLVVVESYPQFHGLIVGFMLASQNACTLIPPILWKIWIHRRNTSLYEGGQKGYGDPNLSKWSNGWNKIWLCYILLIWLPFTCLYVHFLPYKRNYEKILDYEKELQAESIVPMVVKDPSGTYTATESDYSSTKSSIYPDAQNAPKQGKASWKDFWENLQTPDMLCMAVFVALAMMMYAYYTTVVSDAISNEVSNYLGWMMPTQAIFAILAGWACDYFKTVYVMFALTISLALIFGLSLLSPSSKVHYFVATLMVISQCAVFEVKFTFVAERFDPFNYGKLVGFLGVIGGLATFINIKTAESSNYKSIFTTMTCLTIPLLCMCFFLLHRQSRGITYKTIRE